MPKMALDPPVSEAQRRAMWAAAKGKSTLGIPKSVGKEFVGDDFAKLVADAMATGASAAVALGSVYRKKAGEDQGPQLEAALGRLLDDWEWWQQTQGKTRHAHDVEPAQWASLVSGLLRFFTEKEEAAPAPTAASVMIFCDEETDEPRLLLLKRGLDEENFAGYWSLPGGGVEEGETPEAAAARETNEEIGYDVDADDLEQVDGNEKHVTFRTSVDGEFSPLLNTEHTDYRWVTLDDLPRPIHPGLKQTIARLRDAPVIAGDSTRGFSFLAMDRAIGPFATVELARRAFDLQRGLIPVGLAFDFSSSRVYDGDGRLKVEKANISKACVNPYFGKEIPDYQKHGLDPEKVYRLLRHPEELARAASTFNGVPIVKVHTPTSAADHPYEKVIGSLMNDVSFVHPYLTGSLSIWPEDDIKAIESSKKRQLSPGYYYDLDLEPGTYEGEDYDGVMRNIVGNHLAVVEEGRTGPDVLVGDEQPELETDMSKQPIVLSRTGARFEGVLAAVLTPKLAKDDKGAFVALPDLKPVLKGITRKSIMATDGKTIKKGVLEALYKAAWDAVLPAIAPAHKPNGHTPDDVIMHLLGGAGAAAAAEPTPDVTANSGQPAATGVVPPPAGSTSANPSEQSSKVMDWARTKGMDEASLAELQALLGAPAAAPPKPSTGDTDNESDDDPDSQKDKGAMDQKTVAKMIATARTETETSVLAAQRALRQAERDVRPYIGDLALDSAPTAAAVYKLALDHNKVDTDGVHESAYPALLKMLPKPGDAQKLAADAALITAPTEGARESFNKLFPGAERF